MRETEFSETGVRIDRWARSLTRAGQVTVKDGRVALLTSYGREIDSAPHGHGECGQTVVQPARTPRWRG